MNTSDISVIIPAFNAERFIAEAIESVLLQTIRPREIIVVDDGSTDDTAEIVNLFPDVVYKLQNNQGAAVASNTGVEISTGSFISFLDADDLWLPTKLAKQLEVFRRTSDVDLVFTWIENFIESALDHDIREKLDVSLRPMIGIQKSTLCMKRSSFDKVGNFTPSASIDLLDWYARSRESFMKECIIEEVLVRRRIHGGNQSIVKKETQKDFPGILKGILDRRRSLK